MEKNRIGFSVFDCLAHDAAFLLAENRNKNLNTGEYKGARFMGNGIAGPDGGDGN